MRTVLRGNFGSRILSAFTGEPSRKKKEKERESKDVMKMFPHYPFLISVPPRLLLSTFSSLPLSPFLLSLLDPPIPSSSQSSFLHLSLRLSFLALPHLLLSPLPGDTEEYVRSWRANRGMRRKRKALVGEKGRREERRRGEEAGK